MKQMFIPPIIFLFSCMEPINSCPQEMAADGPLITNPTGQVMVATCQFPVSSDVIENASWIRSLMNEASKQERILFIFLRRLFRATPEWIIPHWTILTGPASGGDGKNPSGSRSAGSVGRARSDPPAEAGSKAS